jgi:hypothetical protein
MTAERHEGKATIAARPGESGESTDGTASAPAEGSGLMIPIQELPEEGTETTEPEEDIGTD